MKKVRFQSPDKPRHMKMSDSECHSPRPFLGTQFHTSAPDITCFQRVLPYSNDPVLRYENSNSSPYPSVAKTNIEPTEKEPCWRPSNDLDLSLLDTSFHEPRHPIHKVGVNSNNNMCNVLRNINTVQGTNIYEGMRNIPQVLTPIENDKNPPNVLVKDNSFFIRRDNLNKFNINSLNTQLNKLCIGKENSPVTVHHQPINTSIKKMPVNFMEQKVPVSVNPMINECGCYHCKVPQQSPMTEQTHGCKSNGIISHCKCTMPQPKICHCKQIITPVQKEIETCSCHTKKLPQNAVDKKTWILEKYQQNDQENTTEIQKQTNVTKEKREPTVADLFKIIKLQNEQLQLLQEKVDKFITSRQNPPTLTCTHTEHVAMTTNNTDNEQVKMSIGVMTSFEMVHTSTVINKEVMKENAQIQCSKSQISIKEVVSQPDTMNFLDGISPVNSVQPDKNQAEQKETGSDEKTLNEVSLYNVQVDNATTPLMSPDQTLYLDVRDYSESDAESVDQSNVGWTYYNKVMTHVNGMLQDSEMPSSASAMYRNMRQHCMQMQIDKTNVSVTKRVKFGDDPLGIHQPHIYQPAATDTSLKMKQLAAKYLNNAVAAAPTQRPPPKVTVPVDMSFATRNYMERHQLLQALPSSTKSPSQNDIPRFLDITALKQQPKFL